MGKWRRVFGRVSRPSDGLAVISGGKAGLGLRRAGDAALVALATIRGLEPADEIHFLAKIAAQG